MTQFPGVPQMEGEIRVGEWIIYRPWVVQYQDELMWYDHEHPHADVGFFNVGVKITIDGKIICRDCGAEMPKGVRQYARMLKHFKDWNI